MHKTVLLQETIDLVSAKEGGAYIDATCGAGGHTQLLSNKAGTHGKVLAIDKDAQALEIAKNKVKGGNVTFVCGDFKEIAQIAAKNQFSSVDGIIADLGVSSMQLDEASRGFSFAKHAELDMRMDRTQDLTAKNIISDYSEEKLTEVFTRYGEEPFARGIAHEIVKTRETSPIIWTDQLAEVVRRVVKQKPKKIDPATKVFQALRIEVNGELSALESALPQMVSLLSPQQGQTFRGPHGRLKEGGRMAIISFHSLEDRIVKQFIEEMSRGCTCPPEFPKCVCGKKPILKKVTKKPVTPSENEIRENPRSRSAKLRVAERI